MRLEFCRPKHAHTPERSETEQDEDSLPLSHRMSCPHHLSIIYYMGTGLTLRVLVSFSTASHLLTTTTQARPTLAISSASRKSWVGTTNRPDSVHSMASMTSTATSPLLIAPMALLADSVSAPSFPLAMAARLRIPASHAHGLIQQLNSCTHDFHQV